MSALRTFVALELPLPVITRLIDIRQAVARNVPRSAVRWVQPEAMHLTLRFLGDTTAAQVSALATDLAHVATQYTPLQLRLTELGYFPGVRRPRVVWVGLGGDNRQLAELQRAVEHVVVGHGWEAEQRRFQPHLTLGRIKDARQLLPGMLPAHYPLPPTPFVVTHFNFVKSELRPQGAVHTVLHRFTLE